MKKIIKNLKTVGTLYLAVLVVCSVMTGAGMELPGVMRWLYTPVVNTTAYAASLQTEPVVAEVIPEETVEETVEPESRMVNNGKKPMNVEAGIFKNSLECTNGQTMEYVIRIPKNMTTNMPLVVYLHEGVIQDNPSALSRTGVMQAAEELDINSCVIIQPSCPTTWCSERRQQMMQEVVAHVIEQCCIDVHNVVLTGYDDGAAAVWYYAALMDNWTKISPVGCAPRTDMRPLVGRDIECYIVYGEFEEYKIKSGMKAIGETLAEHGAFVQTTVSEGARHNDMATAGYTQEWFDWATN